MGGGPPDRFTTRLDGPQNLDYTQRMPKNKNRRVQTPKTTIVRSRSIETMEFQLQGRGGRHVAATAYKRVPKHRNQGVWDD